MALSINLEGSCFCIITGASKGIGRALAIECSRLMGPGSVLLLLARNLQGLQVTKSLTESTNVKVLTESVDLSSITLNDTDVMLGKVMTDYEVSKFTVNMIIHNAGSVGDVTRTASQLDSVELWRNYFDLNVFNVSVLNSAFLKAFKSRDGRKVVVNITSLCGIQPFAGLSLYCSGKAAREMYFKVLAQEEPDIVVLNYSPGPVETDMVDAIIDTATNQGLKEMFVTNKSTGKLLKPEQTAKKCLAVLSTGSYKSGDHVDYFDNL